MPSTDKTSLGLNQWLPSDRPKFDDHNSDNKIIDSLITNANSDILHKADKPVLLWSGTFSSGSITATGIRQYKKIMAVCSLAAWSVYFGILSSDATSLSLAGTAITATGSTFGRISLSVSGDTLTWLPEFAINTNNIHEIWGLAF